MLLFGACANSYQKALKNPDNRAKLEMADTYYKKKDFARAISLYEMVEDAFNGTPTAEKIIFNSAQCNFALKQYALAGFQFKTYFENLTQTERAEFDILQYHYKRFKQWKKDVLPFVQEDGRILSNEERMAIWEQQQK